MKIYLTEIDSTNNYAKREYLSFPADEITCILADRQTAGRGRFERKWISPPLVNLYTSFCFRLPNPFAPLPYLAQLMTQSLAFCLIEEGLRPAIKWPNDLLLNGKKVAGVLCETVEVQDPKGTELLHKRYTSPPNDSERFDAAQISIFESREVYIQAIVGVGVNLNMELEELVQIDQPATSLKVETGRTWNRDALCDQLLCQFTKDLKILKNRHHRESGMDASS